MLRSGVKARSRINKHESQDGAEQIAAGDVRRRTRLSNGVRPLIPRNFEMTNNRTVKVLATLAIVAALGAAAAPSATRSIDGTYELTKRVMADGTILQPPSVVALYSLVHGRFNLNLFVKNRDGTIASESTIGRYTFSTNKYCEWIVYTTRNNLDKPGVTNEAPEVTDHCTPVTSKNGRFNFSPPGEGVTVSIGPDGFTAKIGDEFVDHWRKIR
jgi:hypothetical protein